ncbi:MAG: hypothetical protein WCG23_03085 [bacterium]
MINNAKTIVSGTFKSEKDLSLAINWLDENGIAKEDINVLISDNCPDKNFKIKTLNKVPEITVRGLTTGTITGAILGSLSFVGIIIVPAIGIAIAGPVIGLSTGIAIGAVSGSVIGAFVGMTIPKYEAVFFDEKTDKSILLVTKADKSLKNIIKRKFSDLGATNTATQ